MFRKFTRVSLEKFLAPHATEEQVLDIGSGGSSYGTYFPNRLTVDIDPARKPEIVADAHELPFPDGKFAVILCTEVLEHLSNPPKAIGEMRRVLRPGGKLILTTRFMYPLHDIPHDYFRYTRYGLEHLFREWNNVSIQGEVATLSTVGVLLQRIVLQTDVRGGKLTKGLLMLLAFFFTKIEWILKAEYGDIKRKTKTTNIFSSGYYLTARR